MLDLEKRVYSRSELVDLFKTTRLDAIQAKIKRAGYIFSSSGRGDGYTLEIQELPAVDLFKKFCIDTLGYDQRTDFQKLKVFLYYFLADDEFMTLQYKEMSEVLEEQTGIRISSDTISNYYDRLKTRGWADHFYGEYVYYIYDNETKQNRYITREEYRAIYREFWATVRANKGDFSYATAKIKSKYGNKPKKRFKEMKSAFFNVEYDELWQIIENEFSQER